MPPLTRGAAGATTGFLLLMLLAASVPGCSDEGAGPPSAAVYPDPTSPDEAVLTLEAPEGRPAGSYLGTYRNGTDPVLALDGLTPDQLLVRFTGFAQLDVQFGAGEVSCAEITLRSLGLRQRDCGNHVRMDVIR